MKKIPLYVALARTIAWQPPEESGFVEARTKRLKLLVDELPSGSGWDCGTRLKDELPSGSGLSSFVPQWVNAECERIVLFGEFHHMNDVGMYDGWTSHEIHVKPSLRWGFELRVTGRDRNDIKDYLHDLFHGALSQLVWEYDYATHDGFVVEDREGEPIEVVWGKASTVWDVYEYDGGRAVRLYSSSGR